MSMQDDVDSRFLLATAFLSHIPMSFVCLIFNMVVLKSYGFICIFSRFIEKWVAKGKVAKLRTKAAVGHLNFYQQCKHCEKVPFTRHSF